MHGALDGRTDGQALFDQTPNAGKIDKRVPTWFVDEQMCFFEHPSAPLRLLMSEAEEPDVAMMSRTLFAAVHGIVLFGVKERMTLVPRPLLEKSIADFVRLNCDGLLQRYR